MRDGQAVTQPVPVPKTDDASLRRYWYHATPAGVAAYQAHSELLDVCDE